MLNLLSTLGTKRDDYGVSDLLAEVSKRSSVSEEDRREIADMSRRVRPSLWSLIQTPGGSPNNSQHDVPCQNKARKECGLLREFGPSPGLIRAPASPDSSTCEPVNLPSPGVLLRDFDTAALEDVPTMQISEDSDCDQSSSKL